jgi:predicted CopG family antitoxin
LAGVVGSLAMSNQRGENIRRTTITVGKDLYAWAMAEAKRRGLNDFSTFIRSLIAAERKRVERKTNEKND